MARHCKSTIVIYVCACYLYLAGFPLPAGSLLTGPPVTRYGSGLMDQDQTRGRTHARGVYTSTTSGIPGNSVKSRNEDPGVRDLESLKVGEKLKGVVVGELDGKTGKKAWVRLGVRRKAKGGRFAYVDGMIRLNKEGDIDPKKVAIDKPVTVFVREVALAEGRLKVSLRRPRIQSSRAQLDSLRPLADLVVGEKLEGVVVTVTDVAAFISCGVGRPTKRNGPDGKPAGLQEERGFLGRDSLPDDVALSSQLIKSDRVTTVIDVGDRVTVYVKEVLQANGRFRLTLDPDITPKKATQQKKAVLRRRSRWNKRREITELEVGEEILGEIVKVREYGFMVDVGAKKNGLVHVSSISEKEKRYINPLSKLADTGDKIYVTVKGLDPEGRLSLAYVERENDRVKGPNSRERRRAARQQGETSSANEGDREESVGLAWDEPFAGLDDGDDDDGFEDIFQ